MTIEAWLRRGVRAAVTQLPYAALALGANIVLFVLSVVSIALSTIGVGILTLPYKTEWVRSLANFHRQRVGIPVPYRPAPANANPWRRYWWIVSDPATWRDLLWLILEVPVGLVLGLVPAALVFYGVEGLSMVPAAIALLDVGYGYGAVWPIDSLAGALAVLPQGALILALALTIAPALKWAHDRFRWALLAPTGRAELALRVRELTDTRSDAIDAQAAELRRIERDLHDGAQARLVSVSLNIGLAEELMTRDPAAAQQLLAEARESSGQALVELRDLVRGIHPPVLADRGLDGAVRSLGLAVPLKVEVTIALPGRPPPPVESAAYFAVAEALANVTKHSGATGAWVRIGYRDDRLLIVVGDNGAGGAAVGGRGGTGLRGIERRLAAFDGTMSVSSPPGGPTEVSMELPCVLSSPKTSPSSGTA